MNYRSVQFLDLFTWKTLDEQVAQQSPTNIEDEVSPLIVTDNMKSFACSMDVTQQNDWNILESMIEQEQNQFCTRLRYNFPMLTVGDFHILLLIRSNMNHINIAHKLNIQIDSFRKSRYRIKKKMKMKGEAFTQFIVKLYRC